MILFSLSNNQVVVAPEALLIQEFSTLSVQELGYVYFMTDYKSSYNSYQEEKRSEQIKTDLGLKTIDEKVVKACKKYAELQETTSMRLLKAARLAVHKLTDFFERGGPKDRNYVKNIENLGKIVESIDKLENLVKKEVAVDGRSKGGRDINEFEK